VSGTWQINGLGYAFNIIGDKGPAMLPWAQAVLQSGRKTIGKMIRT
jgi:hypothetical protein